MRLIVATLLALLFAGAAVAQPYAAYPPVPPPRYEAVPPPPGAGVVWEPGHWHWNGATYVWHRGHYIAQPRGRYVPGHWVLSPRTGTYVWVPAGWR